MNASSPIDVDNLVRLTKDSAQRNEIDAVSNLRDHRIWLFSGAKDSVVKPSVVDDLEGYYKTFVKHSNIAHRKRANAEHAMPTEAYGNACPAKDDPYISDCDYDAAGNLLKWIYGDDLNDKAVPPLQGKLIEFDQSDFITNPGAHGMASTGWVFVPENCRTQAPCLTRRCMVASTPTGTSEWDLVTFGSRLPTRRIQRGVAIPANSIIVLYPQAQRPPIVLRRFDVAANPKLLDQQGLRRSGLREEKRQPDGRDQEASDRQNNEKSLNARAVGAYRYLLLRLAPPRDS
jgi:hypothetical protein